MEFTICLMILNLLDSSIHVLCYSHLLGRQTSSSVVITAMARKKENNEWIISPGGKQIIKSRKTGVFFLKKIENDLVISTLEETDTNSKIFKIEQENRLILIYAIKI